MASVVRNCQKEDWLLSLQYGVWVSCISSTLRNKPQSSPTLLVTSQGILMSSMFTVRRIGFCLWYQLFLWSWPGLQRCVTCTTGEVLSSPEWIWAISFWPNPLVWSLAWCSPGVHFHQQRPLGGAWQGPGRAQASQLQAPLPSSTLSGQGGLSRSLLRIQWPLVYSLVRILVDLGTFLSS